MRVPFKRLENGTLFVYGCSVYEKHTAKSTDGHKVSYAYPLLRDKLTGKREATPVDGTVMVEPIRHDAMREIIHTGVRHLLKRGRRLTGMPSDKTIIV